MNEKLRQAMSVQKRTILDIRVCFDYCANLSDINAVIKSIPPKFGEFKVLAVFEDEGYFMIQNLFEKKGEIKSQVVSYDFYTSNKTCYY